MEAAERLVAEIDPSRNYPEEFVVYRITGYRPDRGGPPVTLVGEALVPDLVNLVQGLSQGLDLSWNDGGRTAVPLIRWIRRLKVSGKTLQRYRMRSSRKCRTTPPSRD